MNFDNCPTDTGTPEPICSKKVLVSPAWHPLHVFNERWNREFAMVMLALGAGGGPSQKMPDGVTALPLRNGEPTGHSTGTTCLSCTTSGALALMKLATTVRLWRLSPGVCCVVTS